MRALPWSRGAARRRATQRAARRRRPSPGARRRRSPPRPLGAPRAPRSAPAARPDHIPSADCVGCHMPRVHEQVPHSVFTDHWIRLATAPPPAPPPPRRGAAPIEAYFARDRAGPEAAIYQAMGAVVYASLANDVRVL